MIDYLRGKLVTKSPAFVVIEVGGLGYRVNFSPSNYEYLPSEGDTLSLWTYLHLRDDGVSLYGFLQEKERDFFLLLISLSKIGPKSALRMLSGLSLPEFKKALKTEDLTTLTCISGIGKKTAERMILELQDKIEDEEMPGTGREALARDAMSALVSLEYGEAEAGKAVRTALASIDGEVALCELVKEALRCI